MLLAGILFNVDVIVCALISTGIVRGVHVACAVMQALGKEEDDAAGRHSL